MNTVTKIAALSPVGLGAVALTQGHYLISHFATIAEIGAAVAVGAAVWTGKSIMGSRKAKAQEPSIEDKVSEALDAFRASQPQQALPRPVQVIDYTNASQAVTKRV